MKGRTPGQGWTGRCWRRSILLRQGCQSHTINRVAPVAQLDRVSGFEPEGCRFESCRARHFMRPSQCDGKSSAPVGLPARGLSPRAFDGAKRYFAWCRLTLPGAPFCDAVAMRRLKTCARWPAGPGLVAPRVRRGEAVLRLSPLTLPGARIRIVFLRTAKWDAVDR